MLDSTSTFMARVVALGLESIHEKMTKKGWDTFGTFGYATAYVPGVTSDDSPLINQVIEPLLGSQEHVLAPRLRKLYVESNTLCNVELRSAYDRPADESRIKKLPAPERATRTKAFKEKYLGVLWTEHIQPAHSVVDKVSSAKEEGLFHYLAPHEVPTREQELDHHKRDATLQVDKQGLLRTVEGSKMPSANVASDLRLRQAFARRGVVYELADVLTYTTHELFVERLFQDYLKEQPHGWAPLTLQQLLAADKKAFKILQDKMPLGPSRDSTGGRAADAVLDAIALDPIFLQLLSPLPLAAGVQTTSG